MMSEGNQQRRMGRSITAARKSEGAAMSIQSKPASTRQDVYSEITSQLIAAIEANPGKPELPWRKSAGPLFMPVNALTQNAYNGINIVSLWVAAEVNGGARALRAGSDRNLTRQTWPHASQRPRDASFL
jgi:hypothetical protein